MKRSKGGKRVIRLPLIKKSLIVSKAMDRALKVVDRTVQEILKDYHKEEEMRV